MHILELYRLSPRPGVRPAEVMAMKERISTAYDAITADPKMIDLDADMVRQLRPPRVIICSACPVTVAATNIWASIATEMLSRLGELVHAERVSWMF